MIKKTNPKRKTHLGGHNAKQLDRDQLLDLLTGMLDEMYNKIMHGRVKDKNVFQSKVTALRAFSYGVSVYGSVLKDKDLDVINDRLDRLEDPQEGSNV